MDRGRRHQTGGGVEMTETLERTPPELLRFSELDDQEIEVLPSRETMCGWNYCMPVYYCHPVFYCYPSWCYG
jgi:hypothetical protein